MQPLIMLDEIQVDQLIMKKFLFLISISLLCCGTAAAELKKASVPNPDTPISLGAVMSQKDSVLKQEKQEASAEVPETNGYVVNEGNVIVDNLTEPKCVFYGNYNSGADGAFQYFNIDTIVFECQ